MVDQHVVLNQVWELFRPTGADDLTIAEHIAALLLKKLDHAPPADPETKPQEYDGRALDPHTRTMIERLVMEAAATPDDAARLVDPVALFHNARPEPSGAYPTPRHLVAFLLRCCDVRPEHDLLDPACGSGGFLAHRQKARPMGATTGYELVRQWSRIAYANTRLRLGAGKVAVLNQNVLTSPLPRRVDRFHRVLVNPPAGAYFDREVLRSGPNPVGEGSSEVVLAHVALDALSSDGRAGILLPDSFFSPGSAETELRARVLTRHHPHAVITLPAGILQPFSDQETHALVVDSARAGEGSTWFFELRDDGYPPGRSRDLTRPPVSQHSDFPLVEAAMQPESSHAGLALGESANVLERVAIVSAEVDGETTIEGVVIQARPAVEIKEVAWHPLGGRIGKDPSWSLSLVLDRRGESRALTIDAHAGTLSGWTPGLPGYSTTPRHASAVVVTSAGTLLGVRVSSDAVRRNGILRPAWWLPQPQAPGRRPATAHGHAGAADEPGAAEPPAELEEAPASYRPIPRAAKRPHPFADAHELAVYGELSPEQKRVYDAVRALPTRRIEQPGAEPYEVVAPFSRSDVSGALAHDEHAQELDTAFVEETLGILEAMGILVVGHARQEFYEKGLPYYRLATPWDRPDPVLAEPAAPVAEP